MTLVSAMINTMTRVLTMIMMKTGVLNGDARGDDDDDLRLVMVMTMTLVLLMMIMTKTMIMATISLVLTMIMMKSLVLNIYDDGDCYV